jgi:hypothetical protein
MPQGGFLQARMRSGRPICEIPIGREKKEEVLPLPMPLPDLEDRLLARDIIPAMPVEDEKTSKAMPDEVLQQAAQ